MKLGSCSIVAVKDAFYIFDGFYQAIYRFSVESKWDYFGRLVNKRRSHNVIYDGTDFYVVGGEDDTDNDKQIATERCNFLYRQKLEIVCFSQVPSLEGFLHPALFIT